MSAEGTGSLREKLAFALFLSSSGRPNTWAEVMLERDRDYYREQVDALLPIIREHAAGVARTAKFTWDEGDEPSDQQNYIADMLEQMP